MSEAQCSVGFIIKLHKIFKKKSQETTSFYFPANDKVF